MLGECLQETATESLVFISVVCDLLLLFHESSPDPTHQERSGRSIHRMFGSLWSKDRVMAVL